MKIETVYTADEWMKYYERNYKKIIRRYILKRIKYYTKLFFAGALMSAIFFIIILFSQPLFNI